MVAPTRDPQQLRSRLTLARIEASAFALLAEAGWPGVTVAAVAAHAGVSRGALYARFGCRSDLVEFVRARYHEGLNATQREAFARVDRDGSGDLGVVVSDAVGAVAEVIDRYGPVMAVLRHDPHEIALSGAARSVLYERFARALLAGGGDQIVHAQPGDAVGFAFRIVFEALTFSSADPDAVPAPLRRSPENFREQLSAMVLAYLTTTTSDAGSGGLTRSG